MSVKKDGKEYYSYTDYQDTTSSGADKTFLSEDQQAQISQYKADWEAANAAGDRAGMDAAHAAAEAIREQAGYSGGANGGAYNELVKNRGGGSSGGGSSGGSSSGRGSASGEPVRGGQAVKPFTYTPFTYESAPTYVNKYQSQIDDLTAQILGREAFSYDPEGDETYRQYRERYTREGERAMRDTLGQVSARTGGLASSYAGVAAQQTYDNYMAALADKIPELRQLAYQMYQDEGSRQRDDLALLTALEQGDYAKYQGLLSQYNADRNFVYGQYSDGRNLDYQIYRDTVGDSRYNSEWAYQQERDAVGDRRYDSEWAYQTGRDQIADKRYEDETAYDREQDEWQKRNYASETEYDQALRKAETLAQAGDFSGYRAMGYTDTEIAGLKAAYDRDQAAKSLAAASRGSGGASSGGAKGNGTSKDSGESGDIYRQLYDAGVRSYADAYAALLAQGYNTTSAHRLANGLVEKVEAGDFETAETGGGGVDMSSVTALGFGPISAERLDELIRSGQVEEYEEDGVIRFRRKNGSSTKLPVSGAAYLGGGLYGR